MYYIQIYTEQRLISKEIEKKNWKQLYKCCGQLMPRAPSLTDATSWFISRPDSSSQIPLQRGALISCLYKTICLIQESKLVGKGGTPPADTTRPIF